jgi:hypothetical protein
MSHENGRAFFLPEKTLAQAIVDYAEQIKRSKKHPIAYLPRNFSVDASKLRNEQLDELRNAQKRLEERQRAKDRALLAALTQTQQKA